MKLSLSGTRAALLIAFVFWIATATGQRRKCPLENYNGNWAYGTTEKFHVGDPFDGIGQVEVMRPGKRTEIHEKNRKWYMDGKQVKPGQVFTKPGQFIMTIETNGYKTAYNVEIFPAVGPPRPTGKVISYPKQTEYKVGDHFYVDGYQVVAYDSKGKEVTVEPREVTFFTSVSNTMVGVGSQCGGGYKFSTSGTKVIEVRYNYVTIGKFTINVAEKKSTTAAKTTASNTPSTAKGTASSTKSTASTTTVKPKAMAEGWYNLRAMNNYLNLDASGAAELRKKTSNQAFYIESKGDGKVALRMKNGKYLGLSSTLRDGVRVKVVDKPYLWACYSENNNDIFSLRPSGDTKFVMNASGEKNTDGTQIVIWTHSNKNAPNHAEFRFIKVQNP